MTKDHIALTHIIDAIDLVQQYLPETLDLLEGNCRTQDAIIRRLEVIGEATKRLSPTVRETYPNVPWRQATVLRDVLSNDSMSVNMQPVWNVAVDNLPQIRDSAILVREHRRG
ncbi:MAG: DUF86 domain-containing protein [Phycisphaerales bacterium]|nr:DUF86 domain-containing protein [Phycisphaerales bacterium]